MFSRSVRRIRSSALPSLVLGIVSFSILVVPGTGGTEPPSYEAELSEGKRLVKEFQALLNAPEMNFGELRKKAFEISQSQKAIEILKSKGYESLGKLYNNITYVGSDSFCSELLGKIKTRLTGKYPADILNQLESIRNTSSGSSAPMDLDIGLKETDPKKLKEIIKLLGGTKGVAEFEKVLTETLREIFAEMAREAGVTINIHKVNITGTTSWHAEAYKQASILKGQVPDVEHAQQTADVTKNKIDEEKKKAAKKEHGGEESKSLEAAWQEAARGTLKDKGKIDRVQKKLLDIELQTGKPFFTEEQMRVWKLLEELTDPFISKERIHAINAEIKKLTGEDIFGACKILIDRMEAALKVKSVVKLALGNFMELLIPEKNGAKRLVLIEEQMGVRGESDGELTAFKTLKEIISRPVGNEFITKMLASQTAKNLTKHAVMFAPMALMNMFVKWEMGQLNDVHELATALIQVVPLESGIELMWVGDKSLADTEVLKAFLHEGFFWGLAYTCTTCAAVLIAGAVGHMAYGIAQFKIESVRLQDYHSELVDLLVYNGEFPDGRFEKLVLLNEQVVERWDMRRFLFETKSVTIRKAVPNWGLRIPLSEKTEEVYKKYYLANDPAMTQFKDASAQLEKNAGCNKNSTENYCRVYDLLQRQMELRRQEVIDAVMIPHLIRLAEQKTKTLQAPEKLKDKLATLQTELEELRGSSLGINLADETEKKAKELANAADTKETKTMTRGTYWQTAFAAYEKIYDLTNDLKAKVTEETGFEKPGLLRFVWSGNFDQDLLRATQSRTGYFLDTAKIKGDINQIKGGTPDLNDTTDKQAFEILGEVAFPWRAAFDQTNKSGPTGLSNPNDIQATGVAFDPKHREGSKFFSEYKEALEKVKALYGKKDDFQAQLKKGATIVKEKDFLLLEDEKGSGFKLKFTDEELKKNLADAALSIQWTANPKGTFKPDDKSLEIKFTPGGPEPVTISIQVEKRGKKETVTGTLKVVLPVKVSGNFLQLTLSPAAPKPGTKVNADTTIDRRFDSTKYKYHYKWSGANCQVKEADQSSTTVTAPKSGEATVTVALLIEDADGKWASLTTKQASLNVGGKPGDKDKKDSGIKQDEKDTRPTATVPTTTTPTPPVTSPATPTPTTPDPTPSTPTTTAPTPPGTPLPTTPPPPGPPPPRTPPTTTPPGPTATVPTTTTPTPPVTPPTTPTPPGPTPPGPTVTVPPTTPTATPPGPTSTIPTPTPPGPTPPGPTATVPTTTTPTPPVTPPTTPTPPGPTATVPTSKDPKSQAEEQYEWMKNIIPYLEKLIELDEKAFTNFEKGVRKDVLGGVASGTYGAPPVPKECSGKNRSEMAARIAEIEKALPKYYKCGMFIEDALTKQKIWGCIEDPQYHRLSSERDVLEICLKGRDAVTYWELKCIDTPARERREHKVMLKAKLAAAKDSKAYNLFKEYAVYDDYKGYLKEIERTKKELGLPDPVPSPVTLPWSYSSSCGGAVVSPPDKTELTVALKKAPEKASYKPGDIVRISAVVTGGKKPYAYTWSGNHAGKGQQVSFTSSKPGDYKLSVGVKDAAGAGGGASITLTIEGITASIEGLGNQVIYGTSLPISVSSRDIDLTDAKKPNDAGRKKRPAKEGKTAQGKRGAVMPSPEGDCDNGDCDDAAPEERGSYRVVWFSDVGLIFDPSTSYDSKTNVLFNRMGPIKIWAEIQKQSGEGVYSTIGETKQEEVTVIPPTFKWTFEPPKGRGKVGQEVKAIITTEPAINADLINYEWSYPESSNRMEYENNASIIGFVPKEPKPMMLLVAPTVPHSREPIGGGLEEEYQAGEYSVSISEPRYRGVKPRIWKPQEWKSPEWKQGYGFEGEGGLTAGGGLVEVADNQFAVFHNIIMKVEVSPSPEKTPRYQWSVAPQGCTISNPIAQEISLNCSNTGTYHVKVVVKDAEGVSLGEASRDLSISISQEELNTAAAKAKPTVTVKAEKTTLTVGESVKATATVDGGKTPYNYKWSGDHEGQGPSVRFSPKKSGDHTLSVEVTDAKGNKGSANITFKVDALNVTIEGLQDEVVYGTKLNLSVKPENHQIVWKAEPAITFTPQQSFGGKTTASFRNIGKVKIWAVAQQQTGPIIGESDKKEISVTAPKFEITFDPLKGKVGDEVTATLNTTPPIDKSLLKFVWVSPQRSDIRPYDANIVRFTPQSIVPVEFLVVAKDPVKNQTLAEITGTYTAEAVKLVVALTTDKTRLKLGETANIRADVTGGKAPYTFNWEGDYTGYGPSVRFNAQRSGQQTLSVEVTDALGNKGSADIGIDAEKTAPAQVTVREPVRTTPSPTSFPLHTTPDPSGGGYDPRKDRSYKPEAKPFDSAEVGNLGKGFQDAQQWNKPKDTNGDQQQQPVPQSGEYLGGTKKAPEIVPGPQQAPYPPPYYPPGPPPGSARGSVGTPWDTLVGQSPGHSVTSPGGGWRSGTSTSSPPPGTTPSKPTPPPSPPSSGTYVMAEITNRSKKRAHIFPEGETFGPGNRFEPGENKPVKVKVPPNNKITFHAGRSGRVIASKTWYYDPAHPDSVPVVIFDESNPYGKLVIQKGLR